MLDPIQRMAEKQPLTHERGDPIPDGELWLDVEALKKSPRRFINRETSWLSFNDRVLEEALNESHPLLERLRFLAIAAANLDEFFMVRVAGLKAKERNGIDSPGIDGKIAADQVDDIQARAKALMKEEQETWITLRGQLEEENIFISAYKDLEREDRVFIDEYFESSIFPLLTPLAIDPAHPFPFLSNKSSALTLRLANTEKNEKLEAILPLPLNVPRFIELPNTKKSLRFCLLEDVILNNLDSLFPPYDLEDSALFRVIRDSEIEIEDEAEDLVENFESALKRRRRGNIILLMIDRDVSDSLMEFLTSNMGLTEDDVIEMNGMIGLADTMQIIENNRPDLQFSPFTSRFPQRIRNFNGDCFAAIANKDILVHHPYESFDVVVQFLRQAARDPKVVSIKQTLYRTSRDSPIVSALIEAAEAGKSVTAMVELKARFDEEANIRWARDLERAGAQVVFGFVDYKTHAKMSLVTRKEGNKLVQYAHFGTGNYHPKNAEIYTDLSYFTCNEALCSDTAKIFNFMTGYATPKDLEKISIAPLTLRSKFYELIDIEIENTKKGKHAEIMAKVNSLVDVGMIDKLYEASQAGVKIRLVVRGICSLRPGIEGLSENIIVTSLIGRFLEHSRIFCFANGKPFYHKDAKVFISSADWMTRNLDHRIEALIPIENETVHKQILDQIMFANICDNCQSWVMKGDGTYERRLIEGKAFNAHEFFMINPSLSGQGSLSKKAQKRKKRFRPLLFSRSEED